MNDLGRYQLGDEVPVTVLTRGPTGAPADPDACPKVDVYSAAKPVKGQGVPILDRQATTGLFQGKVLLDERFSAGRYYAVARWAVGGTYGSEEYVFEVLPGGSGTGQVVALYPYQRPHGLFLLQQRTTGRLYRGRNPRV